MSELQPVNWQERALNAEAEVEGLEGARAGDDMAIDELRTENEQLRAEVERLRAEVHGYEWGFSNAQAEARIIEDDCDTDD